MELVHVFLVLIVLVYTSFKELLFQQINRETRHTNVSLLTVVNRQGDSYDSFSYKLRYFLTDTSVV